MDLPLPRFLGLGTQKGGTTSLHDLLRRHPQVFLPPCKEVHYFSLHYARGLHWYAEQFAAAAPHQRCGDITPYYLFHPEAPARIQSLLPEARMIVLLRDPVERALSGVFHSQRLGLEPLPLAEALAAEPGRLAGADERLGCPGGVDLSHQVHSYVSRSRYEQQLERFELHFARNQLLLVRSEDLFADPEPVWHQVLGFLGLDPWPLPEGLGRSNAGSGEAAEVDGALREQLREQLRPTYAAMAQRYGITW